MVVPKMHCKKVDVLTSLNKLKEHLEEKIEEVREKRQKDNYI